MHSVWTKGALGVCTQAVLKCTGPVCTQVALGVHLVLTTGTPSVCTQAVLKCTDSVHTCTLGAPNEHSGSTTECISQQVHRLYSETSNHGNGAEGDTPGVQDASEARNQIDAFQSHVTSGNT